MLSRFRPLDALRKGAKRSGASVFKSLFIGAQFAVASVLLTAVMVMYAQNAALRAADLWRLPADPLVQIMTSLDSVNVDPDVLAAALLRAPQIKGVTGQGEGVESSDPDPYARSTGVDEVPVKVQTRFIGHDFFATLGTEPAREELMNSTQYNDAALTTPTLYVEVNGRRLAYRSMGHGKPLVLRMRFRGTTDLRDPLFLDSLAAAGFRIITFDYSVWRDA